MASVAKKRSSSTGNEGPLKRVKTDAVNDSAIGNPYQIQATATSKVDANGDRYWEISKMRRVTISSFRGKTMVNIREYYEKDGQELPGKKGISMPMNQFASLITVLPEIEAVLNENGENIPRPAYGVMNSPDESDQEDPSGHIEDAAAPRKNIDATSEEDVEDEEAE